MTRNDIRCQTADLIPFYLRLNATSRTHLQHALTVALVSCSLSKAFFGFLVYVQVYDMFQGQGGDMEAHTKENQGADCDLPCLLPSALRRRLSSLGVPLGDEDFLALMATVDPERRGEISYAGFCEALRLHKLRDNHGATVATQRTSATPTLSSQSMAQVLSTGGVANAGGKGGSKERGVRRAARRRALDLATHAEMNLDGGIFHRNPATINSTNPNFTTTMVKSCGDEKYCPGTRQPPALARSSGNTLPGDLTKKGFVGEEGRSPQRWNETVGEAEVAFRRCLGMKSRCESCNFCRQLFSDFFGTMEDSSLAPVLVKPYIPLPALACAVRLIFF